MKTEAPASDLLRPSVRRNRPLSSAGLDAPLVRSDNTPRAIIVLGVHRSGTSALTRVISLLGADLPKNLEPPNPSNEAGHWESHDLMVIHDEILSSGGSKWDDWRVFNPDWYQSPTAGRFKMRILELLRKDFDNSQLFVIKDPRICRFWPIWRDALAEFGASPAIVISVRNPLEVAASLKRRDGFFPAKSYLLWLRHMLDAEGATRDLPRVVVSYDALLEDWQNVIATLGPRVGVSWPRRGAMSEIEIERFLATRLRHHVIAPEQLAAKPEVVDWAKESYAALIQLAATPEDNATMARLDEIRTEFEKASMAFGVALADGEIELAKREAEYLQLQAAREALRQRVAELSDEQGRLRADADATADKLMAELEGALAALLAEQQKATEQADWIADLEECRRVTEGGHVAAIQESQRLQATAAELRAELDSAHATLSAELQKAAEQSDHLADLEELRSVAETSHVAAAQEVQVLRATAAELRAELDSARATLSAERQKAAEQADRLADLEEHRKVAEASYAAATEEARRHQSAGEALRQRIFDLAGAIEWQRAEAADARASHRDELGRGQAALSAERLKAEEQAARIAELEESRRAAEASHAAVVADRVVLRRDFDEFAHKYAETLAALESVRGEKAAIETANRDLAVQLDQALEEKRRVAAQFDRMSSELRRLQQASAERASAREAAHARVFAEAEKVHEAQIHALRGELVDAEAALSNVTAQRLRASVWARLVPSAFRRRLLARKLVRSGLLDPEWYAATYPDVEQSGLGAAENYVEKGFCRGYRPNPFFDTRWYLERYEDVRRAGVNPLLHYLMNGFREGRDPGPDFQTDFYLQANADVRANGMNPLVHYLRYGRHEGRLPARPA
jgi:hypothetical protein